MCEIKDGFATIATWKDGYELQRITTDRAKDSLPSKYKYGPSKIEDRERVFILSSQGAPIYIIYANPRFSVMIDALTNRLPALEDRAVLMSALIEVLQVRFNLRTAAYSSPNPFHDGLTPLVFTPTKLSKHLDSTKILLERASKIPEISSSMNLQDLAGARLSYQNLASQILTRMTDLGLITRMPQLYSSEKLQDIVTPRGDDRYPFQYKSIEMDNFWLVLSLDFKPAPKWAIRLVEKDPSQRRPELWFRTPEVFLVKDEDGPIDALLHAGLITSTDPEQAFEGLEPMLQHAPEPTLIADDSIYEALGVQSPLLMRIQEFIRWYEALEC